MNVSRSSSIREIRQALISGADTPMDLIARTIERIELVDPEIRAFRSVGKDRALAKAAALGGKPDHLPLYGIPFAVKDMIDVKGMPTTCQSQMRPIPSASTDAWIVKQLEAAGAICVGKLAMGEFSLGPDRSAPGFETVVNPVDPSWTVGSTSTGSAAAVAAGLVPFSIGSDTGGSIRNPAMMTCSVGMKPTTGLAPMQGAFPLAPSLDTIGPIARTAPDLSDVVGVLFPDQVTMNVGHQEHLRIGFVRHFHAADPGTSPEVTRSLDRVASALRASGHILEEISLPPLSDYLDCGWSILLYEAAQLHKEWMDSRADDYHPETLSQLKAGREILSSRYQAALHARRQLTHDTNAKLAAFDLLMTAVSGHPGCRIDDPIGLGLIDKSNIRIPFNVTGHPVVALPGPRTRSGFPVSVQLIGKHREDWKLLRMAEVIEDALHQAAPSPD